MGRESDKVEAKADGWRDYFPLPTVIVFLVGCAALAAVKIWPLAFDANPHARAFYYEVPFTVLVGGSALALLHNALFVYGRNRRRI